jgi:predicted DCC family thiol-disulfide oxidoreductase YuxK
MCKKYSTTWDDAKKTGDHIFRRSLPSLLQRCAIHFSYAPNEGKTATSLFQKQIGDSSPDSIVLFEHDKFYFKSTAALRIARKLSGAWPILYIFMLIPSPVRDWVYNIIAKNRYRWFGRMETCWMPKPEWKEKFLD